MKKTILLLTMILSMTMTVLCLADEADSKASAAFPIREIADITPAAIEPNDALYDETAAENETTNIAAGTWVMKGQDGEWLPLQRISSFYNIYPDGTVTDLNGSLQLPATISDDGSFTIDTSCMEELADYLITGRVSPVSRESMERFNIETDDSYTNYYEDNNQLILTISYPDPRNPLASSPAVTNVYFLRKNSQAAFLQNYISDKVWKIGENTLEMNSDGLLNLNDEASTGKYHVYNYEDPSLYINAKVEFRWDNGGIVKYVPVVVSENSIQLQNIDKPEEILTLEYIKDMEKPVTEEESEEEPSEPDEAAKPFVGEWKITQVLKDNLEINARELLETDSMTAQIKENGYLSLKFSNGFSVTLKPVYEENILKVKYDNAGYNMSWSAVLEDNGTVTAVYNDYTVIFERVR